jgi:hypothetical protein
LSIVLAYHGCTIETAHALLGGSLFRLSDNKYDWLGTGAYFWEWDYVRAYDWAKENRGEKDASVVGAVIELGNCLDLSTFRGAEAVEAAYKNFVVSMRKSGEKPPTNKDPKGRVAGNLALRFLDRAVVTHLQNNMKAAGIKEYDTLRALFPEGEELYPGAGFLKKTHVQIAVRDNDSIRGTFRVPAHELKEHGIPERIYL